MATRLAPLNYALLMVAILLPAAARGYRLVTSAGRDVPVYKVGEKITLSIQLNHNRKPARGMLLDMTFQADGSVSRKFRHMVTNRPYVHSYTMNSLGWCRLTATVLDAHGKAVCYPNSKTRITGGAGAIVEPDKIRTCLEKPGDFDRFWEQTKAELAKIPLESTMKRVAILRSDPYLRGEFRDDGKIECLDIEVACAGGKPVRGYYVRPVNAPPQSCPAVVQFQGAGVRSSWIVTEPAYKGFLSLNINAHGLVNGKSRDFYKKRCDVKWFYRTLGKKARETVYFRGVYLRLMRALEFVKAQPEWDGKHLVVRGFSQGGGQALAAAGLDPDVTVCIASSPGLCDFGGCLAKPERNPGWPHYYKLVNGKPDCPEAVTATAYYDCVFLARRIRAETYIGTGLIDWVCPPTSACAAFNNIPAGVKKVISFKHDRGHSGRANTAGNARYAEILAHQW